MGEWQTLLLKREGDVARLTLHRPEVRNAFNAEMIAELTACLGELARDEDLRVLVLGGEGKVFCAGADVNWMRESIDAGEEENRDDARRMAAMFRALDELPVPVIGRVQGVALGGGVGLVACCDIVLACEGTRFGFTEVKLGILPAVISTFAMRKIGPAQARRWFLTGEIFETKQAREMGLVHHIVHDLQQAEQQVLDLLLANGPRALREAKALMRRVEGLDREAALAECANTIARVRVSAEAQEGLRAFLEKREPGWRAPARV